MDGSAHKYRNRDYIILVEGIQFRKAMLTVVIIFTWKLNHSDYEEEPQVCGLCKRSNPMYTETAALDETGPLFI